MDVAASHASMTQRACAGDRRRAGCDCWRLHQAAALGRIPHQVRHRRYYCLLAPADSPKIVTLAALPPNSLCKAKLRGSRRNQLVRGNGIDTRHNLCALNSSPGGVERTQCCPAPNAWRRAGPRCHTDPLSRLCGWPTRSCPRSQTLQG